MQNKKAHIIYYYPIVLTEYSNFHISELEEESLVFEDAVEELADVSSDEDEGDGRLEDEEISLLKKERVKISQHQSRIRLKRVSVKWKAK